MSTVSLRMLLLAVIAATVGTTATLVRAAAVTSNWDPVNSNGTAVFILSGACLQGNGFFFTNGFDGGTCSLGLVRATVNLVDTSPPVETTGRASFVLDYSSTGPGADFADVWGVDIAGGQVVGVDTLQIGPGVVSENPDSNLDGNWWIQWYDGVNTLDDGSGGLVNTVSLYTTLCTDDFGGTPCPGAESTARTVTFTTTPEPASLSLLLGALGAGWWVRRRKLGV